MKRILAILFLVALISSCGYYFGPYEVNIKYYSFEEAIDFLVADFGPPYQVLDTVFYEDGTVRNKYARWTLDPPIYGGKNIYGYDFYYSQIVLEAWNNLDIEDVRGDRHYGWNVLRYTDVYSASN